MSGTLRPSRGVALGAGVLVLSGLVFGIANRDDLSDSDEPEAPQPTLQPTVTQVVVSEKPIPGPTITLSAEPVAPTVTSPACAEYVVLADDMRAAVIKYEKLLGKMGRAYKEGIRGLGGDDWTRVNKALEELNDISQDTSAPALKIAELDDDMQAARKKCEAAR